MTFISYVNFLPSFVTLVTELRLSLLLVTLMMLAMMELLTSGKGWRVPSSHCFSREEHRRFRDYLPDPCKVSSCIDSDMLYPSDLMLLFLATLSVGTRRTQGQLRNECDDGVYEEAMGMDGIVAFWQR